MATRREGQGDKASSTSPSSSMPDTSPTIQLIGAAAAVASTENRQLHLQVTRRALDETKENIKKSIDEAASEISRYTQAVNDYQEQTFQDTKEIIEGYLETQKEFITSFQSAWDPYIRTNDDGMNYFYQWVVPKWMAQTYTNTVRTIANNIILMTKLANSGIFANIGAFRTLSQQARDNAKELSRLAINTILQDNGTDIKK